MSKFSKILVLGSTGFVGSRLLQILSKKEYKISCLIHKKNLDQSIISNAKEIKIYRDSIQSFNWNILNNNPPDVIFHLARISGRRSIGRMISAKKMALANRRLLSWISSQKNKPLLVFVSGSLSYGSKKAPVTEDSPLHPTSFSKQYFQGELPIYNAITTGNLPIMIMKPSWIYGKGSWFEQFYIKLILEKQIVPLYGNGNNWMSFISVQDCANLIYYLTSRVNRNEVFNLFIGKPILQIEFSRLLSNLTGLPIKPTSNFYLRWKYGKAYQEAFNFSLMVKTKHQKLISNYQPIFPTLKQGLKHLLESYNLKLV